MTERLNNGNFNNVVADADINTSGAPEGAFDPSGWTIRDETDGVGRVESVNIGGSQTAYFNGGGNTSGGSIEQSVTGIPIGKTANFLINYNEVGRGRGDTRALIEVEDSAGNVVFSQTATAGSETVTASFTTADTSYTIRITDVSAGNTNSRDFYVDNASFFVPCFANGTRVSSSSGLTAVEELKVGDQIPTQDRGLQTIRWIGERKLSASDLTAHPKLRPVRIMAGALGAGLPERDILVSRQHRMMVSSKIAQRLFGTTEVLIPAIRLTCLPGIFVDTSVETVSYFHMLFDQHEILFAEGAPTESLYTSPLSLAAVGEEAREEILTLFPEIAELDYAPESARYIPDGPEQKTLLARHLKNNKPCLGAPV